MTVHCLNSAYLLDMLDEIATLGALADVACSVEKPTLDKVIVSLCHAGDHNAFRLLPAGCLVQPVQLQHRRHQQRRPEYHSGGAFLGPLLPSCST